MKTLWKNEIENRNPVRMIFKTKVTMRRAEMRTRVNEEGKLKYEQGREEQMERA